MTVLEPVVIVGAGIAGLAAAGELARHDLPAILLDKGRRPGGRMATRTIDGARFDHGAQHFSARSPEFGHAVREWARQGVVREWFRTSPDSFPGGIEPRHVGVDGMRGIAEHLAAGHDVKNSVHVTRLEQQGARVHVYAGTEVVATGRGLILTPPVPQVRRLLAASNLDVPSGLNATLEGFTYHACLAVMASLDGASRLPDGHLSLAEGPVAWLADNHQKGVSSLPALTIHSTPAFAAAHLESDPAVWTSLLGAAAAPHVDATIVGAVGHRWRYAMPTRTQDIGAVSFGNQVPVVLAGEAFVAAKMEGAYRSGLAAAREIIERS